MQLRPYQLTAVDEIRGAFKESKRVVVYGRCSSKLYFISNN